MLYNFTVLTTPLVRLSNSLNVDVNDTASVYRPISEQKFESGDLHETAGIAGRCDHLQQLPANFFVLRRCGSLQAMMRAGTVAAAAAAAAASATITVLVGWPV